jgi:PKD repeat protein
VNAPITFTTTTMGGTAPYTISWSLGDGTSGTGASITHVYASTQSFTVTETAKDSSSPLQTATDSKTITVYSTPPPLTTSFTVLPSSPVVNSPVTFTATTLGGTAPYTVSWNLGDGATATGATATHTYTGAQSFTVTETVKDSSSPAKTATSSQTVSAAPGGSSGGSGGSGGSNGGCVLCGIVPRISTNMWLLVIGGLMGLVASLALVTVKARANLEHTKRRLGN